MRRVFFAGAGAAMYQVIFSRQLRIEYVLLSLGIGSFLFKRTNKRLVFMLAGIAGILVKFLFPAPAPQLPAFAANILFGGIFSFLLPSLAGILGSASGILLAIVFIPSAGLFFTGAAASVLCIAAAILGKTKPAEEAASGGSTAFAFLLGVAAAGYLTAWTRILSQFFASYAPLIVLASFLAALPLGSYIKISVPAEIGIAISCVATIFAFSRFEVLYLLLKNINVFYLFLAASLLAVFLILLLPASLTGTLTAGVSLSAVFTGGAVGFRIFSLIEPVKAILFAAIINFGTGGVQLRSNSKKFVPALAVFLLLSFFAASTGFKSDLKQDINNYAVYIPAVLSESENHIVSAKELTKEAYEAARKRLGEGIFVQQISTQNKGEEELQIALKTFSSVFPYTSAWLAGGDVIAVGSVKPVVLDYKKIKKRVLENEKLRAEIEAESRRNRNLSEAEIVEHFLAHYFMTDGMIRSFSSNAPLNTEELPVLEFRAAHPHPKRINFSSAVIPPLVNTAVRNESSVYIDFLKVKADMGRDWEEVFSGMRIRYTDVPGGAARGYAKAAIFRKHNTTLTFNAYESRMLRALEPTPTALRFVDAEVQGILEAKIKLERGFKVTGFEEIVINGHRGYIFVGELENHEAKSAALGWFCEHNREIYVVAADYIQEEPEVERVLLSVSCVHRGI